MEILYILLAFAVTTGLVGRMKGRPFILGFVLGFLFGPFALLLFLVK